MLFELGLETFLKGECVGGGAGEARQDFVVVQATDFAGRALDDDIASVTWPSPPSATRFPRRTHTMVVA